MKKRTLYAILYCFLLITTAYGQGWEKEYHADTIVTNHTLEQTSDGGFLIAATQTPPWPSVSDYAHLIRTDVNGDTMWVKNISDLHVASSAAVSGGYILGGYGTNVLLSSNNKQARLVKIDQNGDVLWNKGYGGFLSVQGFSGKPTTDGGYVLAGTKRSSNLSGSRDVYFLKTNANGDSLWSKIYGGTNNDAAHSVIQTTDGGYLLVGETKSFGLSNTDIYIIKTDASGDTIWTRTHGGTATDVAKDVIQTIDGGYLLAGYTNSFGAGSWDAYLVKMDGNGNVSWTETYGGGNEDRANSVVETPDGGYMLTGHSDSYGSIGLDIYAVKTNVLGVVEWTKTYGNLHDDYGTKGIVTASGGYAIVGYNYYWVGPLIEGNVYLIKTDSLGNSYTNYIKGNIFNDTSFNCLKEPMEEPFSGILVAAVGDQTRYGSTDSLGNYCIRVDTGSYIVNASLPMYWQSCANGIPVSFSNFNINDTIDFPFQAQIACPLMEVDLGAPFLRIDGHPRDYTVFYCNKGTRAANNVTVDVTIDPALNILGTSIPIASQTGNVLSFNLGTVNYLECGSFTIEVQVDTANAILGQTHCTEAHIYPDSICLPNPWLGPIIDANVNCLNDSVHFELRNIGGSMFNSQNYYVFEDHFIMNLVGNVTGNIPVNNSFNLSIPAAAGKTYRIEVAQAPGYPFYRGDAIASAAIEGCVPYADGTFNTGFITQFSNGNSAPYIAVDCQQNRGSWDPNDKSAQPAGYGSQHNIYNYTDLDYKIRFQNTGTDTAFLVVIRDTISPLLDLTTLTMGASSHPYTWRIYGAGILEITFANIMLPDSNVNEPASNGFVRYRIEQKAGNTLGSVIYNAADIYFDLNAPITTNQTWHTIDSNFVPVFLMVDKVLDQKLTVKAYPNPFTYSTTIEVQGKEYEALQLTVFDVMGRMIEVKQVENANKIELLRGNLQTGIYLYELVGDNERINTGKIIVQ